mmetsp:Transcript_145170/g.251340  ORF Transcript_145170/g.251340 Transcript_145170/m.251340 type:complete len:312 (-) Transcript_145170:10-945(-)
MSAVWLVAWSLSGLASSASYSGAESATQATRADSLVEKVRQAVYGDRRPFSVVRSENWRYAPDNRYPHSKLNGAVVRNVLNLTRASLWLEVGSFIGNSAITTAAEIKTMGMETGVVCVDPFTGDVDMWLKTHPMHRHGGPGSWDFLFMDDNGMVNIYETFLANVHHAGHHDIVLPIRATSIVGMRLFEQLKRNGRFSQYPEVIYLDSAHEKNETLLELHTAWRILQPGGVLLGDDWRWKAVREDVLKFARSMQLRKLPLHMLQRFSVPWQRARQPIAGVAVVVGQWILYKPLKEDTSPPPKPWAPPLWRWW